MKEEIEVGKIEHVDIRSVWAHEERNFTPWIKGHISVIAELIGHEIEDVESESNVGNYSADLVAKIARTEDLIVIENQFGQTDHNHLGKLLTYLSGKNAKIGVWIAEDFREEHIATLTYLNQNLKSDGPSLYGIKVEAKKIDNSRPAPEFIIVVKPNEFQRIISQESKTDQNRHRIRIDFYTELINKYKELNPNWNKVKPNTTSWVSFSSGKPGFSYSWAFKLKNGSRFDIELYIDQHDQEQNKLALKQIGMMRADIEKELGFRLNFEELPDKRACRIDFSKITSGPITRLSENEKKGLVLWGAEKMTTFTKVMSKYIQKLP
jgi:hypothetical protein